MAMMPTPRDHLGALVALALCLTLASLALTPQLGAGGCFEVPSRSQTQRRFPNILVIVTDDQRQGLSVMPKTRRIFGRGGTEFKNAFVSDPFCCPSRASIFTGQYPHNHHVETETQARNLAQNSTIQHYLQQAGYCTALFGKYLNSWPLAHRPPDFGTASMFTRSAGAYRDVEWNIDGRLTRVPDYSTGFISRGARAFLRQAHFSAAGKPWFLYLAPAAPHLPFIPAKKYAATPIRGWKGDPGARETDRSDKPPFLLAKRKISLLEGKNIRQAQFRTLLSVDDLVAKVFALLRRYHEARNTLAIYTSDNGYLWGEHGVRGKELPYTESIHVPLFLRWPARLPPGRVEDRLVSNVDLAPTVAQAAHLRVDPRYPMDGRSLLQPGRGRRMVLTEYFNDPHFPHLPSWVSLRTHSYEYTEYYEGTKVVFEEYYDLKTDPGELNNVLADAKPRNDGHAAAAAKLLRSIRHCTGSSCP